MEKYVWDTDQYDIVTEDGFVIAYDGRAFLIQDAETGECFTGLMNWFSIIAGEEYAKENKGSFGGEWYDYFMMGVGV